MRIRNRHKLVDFLEVIEQVDVDLLLEQGDDIVTAELDVQHVRLEVELSDRAKLHIVPKDEACTRVAGVLASAHESDDVGAEEEVGYFDAAVKVCNVSANQLLTSEEGDTELLGAENAKASAGRKHETLIVLVKVHRVDRLLLSWFHLIINISLIWGFGVLGFSLAVGITFLLPDLC